MKLWDKIRVEPREGSRITGGRIDTSRVIGGRQFSPGATASSAAAETVAMAWRRSRGAAATPVTGSIEIDMYRWFDPDAAEIQSVVEALVVVAERSEFDFGHIERTGRHATRDGSSPSRRAAEGRRSRSRALLRCRREPERD
jgi:hypothetical protein